MKIKNADDKAVSALGSTAGALVAPKTGLKRLRTALTSPGVLLATAGVVAAYALSRRPAPFRRA